MADSGRTEDMSSYWTEHETRSASCFLQIVVELITEAAASLLSVYKAERSQMYDNVVFPSQSERLSEFKGTFFTRKLVVGDALRDLMLR